MNTEGILALWEKYGLDLQAEMTFNEMGADFQVVFVKTKQDESWVLRIPRRPDLLEQIAKEQEILTLVKRHLTIDVPDWQIVNQELIAYPLLPGNPVLTYDPITYEVTWNMDQNNPRYVRELAKVMVALHRIPKMEANKMAIKSLTPDQMREEILNKIEVVKIELGIGVALETQWRKWLDNEKLWPSFSSFIHGDLYAGHIIVSTNGMVSGIIDWSEGQMSDIAIDFAGHLTVFGEESLKKLIAEYESLGGKTWEYLFEQAVERQAASPLNYAYFAIETKSDFHLEAAKKQLIG